MFWRVCEWVGDSPVTTAFDATFRDQASANQINSLGFAFVSEKLLRNLCCRNAGVARDESLNRVCHRDKVPATISPTRYRSVANVGIDHPPALHGAHRYWTIDALVAQAVARRSDKLMGQLS